MKRPAPARRSHYLYFVLAAFDVVTVCIGLYFSHTLMGIYVDSVAVNQAWAHRVSAFTRLSELAAATEAPGNDIFVSGDAEAELSRMAKAAVAFQAELRRARAGLEADLPASEAAPLLAKLDAVAQAMKGMTGEGRVAFAYFRDKRPVDASVRMASMDRRYSELNRALDDLREQASIRQQQTFAHQLAGAARQELHLYLIGALLLFMVGGATFYGHRLATQAHADATERARQSCELEATNERLLAETRQRMAALDALQQANDKLRSLFKRTLELQDQKQQYIARELHEEVSQTLASLKLRLSSTPALKGAGSLAEDALHRLRDIAQDLTPHGMEMVGLAAVLPAQLPEWTRGSGLRVRFANKLRLRPPFRIENAAYRVAQEAVSNVVRHAAACSLRVEICGNENELVLRVADDGRGFDPQAARGQGALGIALMEERTAMLGGTVEIRSSPGRGTVVAARFPLQQQIDWVGPAGA